jgi:hypothetical protein
VPQTGQRLAFSLSRVPQVGHNFVCFVSGLISFLYQPKIIPSCVLQDTILCNSGYHPMQSGSGKATQATRHVICWIGWNITVFIFIYLSVSGDAGIVISPPMPGCNA